MPFKRQKTREALERGKTAALEDYLQALDCSVTAENVAVDLRVSRGPDWIWGDEDGAGSGVILSYDQLKGTAEVLWESGKAQRHYRFGQRSEP